MLTRKLNENNYARGNGSHLFLLLINPAEIELIVTVTKWIYLVFSGDADISVRPDRAED